MTRAGRHGWWPEAKRDRDVELSRPQAGGREVSAVRSTDFVAGPWGRAFALKNLLQCAIAALLHIRQTVTLTACTAHQQTVAQNNGAEKGVIAAIRK